MGQGNLSTVVTHSSSLATSGFRAKRVKGPDEGLRHTHAQFYSHLSHTSSKCRLSLPKAFGTSFRHDFPRVSWWTALKRVFVGQ